MVAVEMVGNWCWIVDDIEVADMVPCLVHSAKAKLILEIMNKTGRLDCRGVNQLQRTGTVPVVWIPPQRGATKETFPVYPYGFQSRMRLSEESHSRYAGKIRAVHRESQRYICEMR